MARLFSAFRGFGLSVVLLLVAACSSSVAAPASLREAENLYFQSRVGDAEQAFKALIADPTASADDRVAAWRDLARIQWLIDRDAKAALRSLDNALVLKADLCRTVLMDVNVLDESGSAHAAALLAGQRAGDCPGMAHSNDLMGAEAKADLDDAAANPDVRRERVAQAAAVLARLSPETDASPNAQKLRLAWALQAGDGRAALEAWKGFFWLTDHNAPTPFGMADAEVARLFHATLGPTPKLADEVGLLKLLIRGGFYTEAQRLDAARGIAARAKGDPAYRQVALYFAMRTQMDAEILAFNRATARGKRNDRAFIARMESMTSDWGRKVAGDASPSARNTDPFEALQKAYGLHGTIGDTGGFASMHAGHVVQDERMVIDQFGRTGEVRFMVIENLVSNGYLSWLWDGGARAGGWSAKDGTIVQVRPAYTSGSLSALASFQPEIARQLADRQPALEKADLDALAKSPVAYLPGLQQRLREQAAAQVAAKSRAEAARTGQPFARVFARNFWDADVGHSIRAHEGRHSLDNFQFKGAQKLEGWDLEYRAKLSEIQLGEFPRMPLDNIQASDIGGTTPHGVANTKVMEGYRAWMDAHPAEIKGFDPRVQTLEQLDKLTDQQMRDVARGLDPQFKR